MLLSISIIIIGGFLSGWIAEKLRLPRLFGMLLFGIFIGPMGIQLLGEKILLIADDLKEMILVIILLRAGLSLDIDDLKKIGLPAVLMSFIPACFEIAATTFIAPLFLDITTMDALLLGTVIASSSPAVIVPRMVRYIEEGYGVKKNIPQLILAGDSIDDVFNIVLFTSILTMQVSGEVNFSGFLNVPVNIFLGVGVGIILGFLLVKLLEKVTLEQTKMLFLLLALAFLLLYLETYFAFSALLAIMTIGLIFYKKIPTIANTLSDQLKSIWVLGETFLFVLLGSSVNLAYTGSLVMPAIIVLTLVLFVRAIGIYLCVLPLKLNFKENLFCMLTGIPKATVQAAIGGLPLAAGLASGEMILAISAISILFTAPVGAFLLDNLHKVLLEKKI